MEVGVYVKVAKLPQEHANSGPMVSTKVVGASQPPLMEKISLGNSLYVHHISAPCPSVGILLISSPLSSYGKVSSISIAPVPSPISAPGPSPKDVCSLPLSIVASHSSHSNSSELEVIKYVLRNKTIV